MTARVRLGEVVSVSSCMSSASSAFCAAVPFFRSPSRLRTCFPPRTSRYASMRAIRSVPRGTISGGISVFGCSRKNRTQVARAESIARFCRRGSCGRTISTTASATVGMQLGSIAQVAGGTRRAAAVKRRRNTESYRLANDSTFGSGWHL